MDKLFPIEDIVSQTICGRIGLAQNGRILAGVSGGADSVCLLHLLNSLSNKLGFSLEAAHINHMLRGTESDADEEYVQSLCARLGIPLHVSRSNITEIARSERLSIEEAGREVRYAELHRIADEIGADLICVAHNQNDQAETVMMNLIRGAGLDGLEGMAYRSGRLARPLLDVPRAETERYCARLNLKPRTDSSNLKTIYTRNMIRLRLFPFIEKKFGRDIIPALVRMSGLLRRDKAFIDAAAKEAYKRIRRTDQTSGGTVLWQTCRGGDSEKQDEETSGRAVSVLLDSKELTGLHGAISSRVIRLAIAGIKGNLKGIEQKHLTEIERLAKEGRAGAVIHLPNGLRARKSYDAVELFIKKARTGNPDFETELVIPGKTLVTEAGLEIEAEIIERGPDAAVPEKRRTEYVQDFDYDLIKKGIRIRKRKNGDRISPKGFAGTKKLKSYLIDKKIERHKRDSLVLLAEDTEAIWIVGLETSEKYSVTENTRNILRLRAGKIT